MRFLFLLLVLPLAACGAFDCPSAGPYTTTQRYQNLTATPEASDTLFVVVDEHARIFGYVREVYVAIGAETPRVSEAGETSIGVELAYSNYNSTPENLPRLVTESLQDTIRVRFPESFAVAAPPRCAEADGIVQPVCSYAEPEATLFFKSVTAPAGVEHVEYLWRNAYGRLQRMPKASTAEAATRSRQRQSVRG